MATVAGPVMPLVDWASIVLEMAAVGDRAAIWPRLVGMPRLGVSVAPAMRFPHREQ
jgi:hypothetical protein